MPATLLSVKGQVVIPKALREARHWAPGTRFEIHETPEGVLLKPVGDGVKRGLSEGLAALRQRANYRGPTVTVEGMRNAITAEAGRRGGK